MALPALGLVGKSLLGSLKGGEKKEPEQKVTPKTPMVSGVTPKQDPKTQSESVSKDSKPTESPTKAPKNTSISSPLFKKSGMKAVDSALQNVSKSLGSIKATLYSKSEFDKKKREKAKKAKTKTQRQRKERESEKSGPVGVLMSSIMKPTKSFMGGLFKFLINIVLGTLTIFVLDNIEKITEAIKGAVDVVKDLFDQLNKWVITPVFNMVKAIADPINKAINNIIPNIPDFDKENSDIESELGVLDTEKDSFLNTIPLIKDAIKGIENLIKHGDPSIDKEEFDQQVAERDTTKPDQVTPPSERNPFRNDNDAGVYTGDSPQATPPTDRPSPGQPTPPSSAGGYDLKLAKLLKDYEGLRTKAYLDSVGIPTIGMGATYYPKGFRLKGNVKMGDTITEDEALWIKTQHIKEHRERLLKELPSSVYNKLPDGVKAALESKVFNYGNLGAPLVKLVTNALKTGNFKPVADYFRNVLANHDGGINSWRRNDEATLIMTGKSARNQVNFGTSATPAQVQPSSEKTQPTPPSLRTGQLTDLVSRQGLDKLYGAPTGPVRTSERGMRNGRHHAGIDFGTGGQKGWYCSFRMKGTVSFVGSLPGYGKTVIINSGGYDFLFAHLARYNVRQGEQYNGQVIGEIETLVWDQENTYTLRLEQREEQEDLMLTPILMFNTWTLVGWGINSPIHRSQRLSNSLVQE